MGNNFWIKLYNEMMEDPKVGRLSDAAHRVMINCFLLAGEMGEEGRLPSLGDMVWRFRMTEEKLLAGLAELAKAEIVIEVPEIDDDKAGHWFVRKFAVRQAKIGDAEKQKAYRDRQRDAAAAGYGFEERGNETVTATSRSDEKSVTGEVTGDNSYRYQGVTDGNRHRYEGVTDGNAEIEEEIEIDEEEEREKDAESAASSKKLVKVLYELLKMDQKTHRPGKELMTTLADLAGQGVTGVDLRRAWDWYVSQHGVDPPRLAVLEKPMLREMARRAKAAPVAVVDEELMAYVQH